MIKEINIGNPKTALKALTAIKNSDGSSADIRITNSHIKELNKIIGKNVFKKDALYVSSRTLWELMQPLGGKGWHHYHDLSPKNIYDVLNNLKRSKEVIPSYDGRYLVITIVTVFNEVHLVVILEPNGALYNDRTTSVNRIITIYPYKK